jgi:hypothetical protein
MKTAAILLLAAMLAGCAMPEAKGRRVCLSDGSFCTFQYHDGSGAP